MILQLEFNSFFSHEASDIHQRFFWYILHTLGINPKSFFKTKLKVLPKAKTKKVVVEASIFKTQRHSLFMQLIFSLYILLMST